MNRKRIGIFGGTFNPVHNAHIALARRLVAEGVVNEVWLTLSPANPLKVNRPGASDADRMDMLRAACASVSGVKPCFIEFELPRPSYTINTLGALAEKYPHYDFKLIIGADNWLIFDKWRSYQEILDKYGVIIYPRPGYQVSQVISSPSVEYLENFPETDVSSTHIRNNIPGSLSLVDPAVASIIINRNLYATI